MASQSVQVLDPRTGTVFQDLRTLPGAVNAVEHDGGPAVAQLGVGEVDAAGSPIAGGFVNTPGFASDGETLYVSDWALGTVTAVSGAGSTVVASWLANPEGLAIDGNRLLVVEEAADRVSVIDLTSRDVRPIIEGLDPGPDGPVSPFAAPHGTLNRITVGPDGSICVSQGGDNAVYEFRR